MITDERHIEAAEAAVLRDRDGAVARAQGALAGPGAEDCEECGAPIGAARRAALPSAMRCISCQTRYERGARGY